MSTTSSSPPTRKRSRGHPRGEGRSSSSNSDHSDEHGEPPANQQKASADRLRALSAESALASSSRAPEQHATSSSPSKQVLYPSSARLTRWPHFVAEKQRQGQGQVRTRAGSSPRLEASLYGEVQRIAQHFLKERKRKTEMQSTAVPAPEGGSDLDQGGEPVPSAQSGASPLAPSASSPSPTSPISSRSASSLEFSEDEDLAIQAKPRPPSQGSDSASQPSLSSVANLGGEGGESNILSDTLLNPIVLGVQAHLDALLYSLAMEHSARQMRASSKKERKRPMGHEEVLGLLQRDLEMGSFGMVELQRRKSVLSKTREEVKRARGSEAGDQGATEDAGPEHNGTTVSAPALPDTSAHNLLSQDALQSRASAAQQDAILLLEPLGLHRTVSKRKRKAKKKQKPSEERPTTEDETEPPRKAEKQQRREQAIRGGGGFLLCRPPISHTSP